MTLTLLVISPLSGSNGLTLPPYAARGLDQTLDPITNISGSGGNVLGVQLRRDVNGNLGDFSKPQFHKYASTITCTDGDAPAFDDVWLGQIVEVDCAAELRYLTATGSPARTVVDSRVEGDYTYYRPRLTMMITGIKNTFKEYPALYNWQIDLQEV